MNEIIWNNRFICIDKKSVYRSDLVNLGIIKVSVTAVKSIVYSFRSTRETLDTVLFTIRKFVLP